MTTEFTKKWLDKPQNQRLINEAHEMAQHVNDTGEQQFHPFFLFQEMACRDFVWSQKDLNEQGWTEEAIKEYLSSDVIFSFNGISIYLAHAVKEAAIAMPDGPAKTRIVIHKLCR
jgi:hypothetical protein